MKNPSWITMVSTTLECFSFVTAIVEEKSNKKIKILIQFFTDILPTKFDKNIMYKKALLSIHLGVTFDI